MKTTFIISLGLLVGIGIFYLVGPLKAKSASSDMIALHILTEVSANNGQTWQNNTGTDYSGGQIAYPCQNGTVQIRTRIWNTGTANAYQVTGQSSFSNSTYISQARIISNDSDGDGVEYTRVPFINNGSIYVGRVNANTSADNGYEGATVTVQLTDICPRDNDNPLITGKTNIQNYSSNTGGQDQQQQFPVFENLIRPARATGIGNNSTIAFEVCGGCRQDNQTAVSNITNLPQTGADL